MDREHVGTFFVSYRLLEDVLHLPIDAEILRVDDGEHQTFQIWVSHPDIPSVKDNELLPELSPQFRSNVPVEFISWGVKDPPEVKDE